MSGSQEQDIRSKAEDIAGRKYGHGCNCAQSVILACSEVLSLENGHDLVNSCSGLTGGLGHSGCCCGALLGGVLTIGAKYGGKSRRNNKKTLDMTEELYKRFKERFSTPCCRGLRKGIDFKDKRIFEHCKSITVETAGMVAELIGE
jgi:C_GCAxxG_C_C family probable redox protein